MAICSTSPYEKKEEKKGMIFTHSSEYQMNFFSYF